MGYKLHARCDEDGFIEKVHVTAANAHESRHLEPLLDDTGQGQTVLADKGYASKANRSKIRSKGYHDDIMRNRPLTEAQRAENQLIKKHRYIIEQCFGTLKRRFGFRRASYFSQEEVNAQSLLKAMCHNLLKAINRVDYA